MNISLPANAHTIYNIKPMWFTSHTTTIPANTSSYIESFNKVLNMPTQHNHHNIIESITISVPLIGMRNITITETALLNAVPVIFPPGLYLIQDLVTLLSLTIPTSGPNSYTATTTVPLDLSFAPQLSNILNFSNDLIPANTTGGTINLMNGYDIVLVSSSLTYQSNDVGEVFLAIGHITDSLGNRNDEGQQLVGCPVLPSSPNSISWALKKVDGTPWTCSSPITIQINIYSYIK